MIDHISLNADKTTLNPLLAPGDCAILTLQAQDHSGQNVPIDPSSICFGVATIAASGNAEVARLDENRLIALEGGVAEVTASLTEGRKNHQSRLRTVVRPFFLEYHKILTLKLFLGQEKHPDPAWAHRLTLEQALEIIRNFAGGIAQSPFAHDRLACGGEAWHRGFLEVLVVGDSRDPRSAELLP